MMPVIGSSAGAIAASASPAAAASGSKASTNPAQGGQDMFLKLLMAQMQNQDPMSPMSNTDMTSQLAQFSQVQGLQTLNAGFANMLLLQQMTQGANLVGKTVLFNKPGSATPGNGIVSAVSVANGDLQLSVGGNTVPLSQVKGFTQPATPVLGGLFG
jgi:flagellar basal-body rod modification protein FlgD